MTGHGGGPPQPGLASQWTQSLSSMFSSHLKTVHHCSHAGVRCTSE